MSIPTRVHMDVNIFIACFSCLAGCCAQLAFSELPNQNQESVPALKAITFTIWEYQNKRKYRNQMSRKGKDCR